MAFLNTNKISSECQKFRIKCSGSRVAVYVCAFNFSFVSRSYMGLGLSLVDIQWQLLFHLIEYQKRDLQVYICIAFGRVYNDIWLYYTNIFNLHYNTSSLLLNHSTCDIAIETKIHYPYSNFKYNIGFNKNVFKLGVQCTYMYRFIYIGSTQVYENFFTIEKLLFFFFIKLKDCFY